MAIRYPWLIQRCVLADDDFSYDYMCSVPFQSGAGPESLKRLFRAGVVADSVQIKIMDEISMTVWVVMPKGFPLAIYQPFIQEMANNTRQLYEPSHFDLAVQASYGRHEPQTANVWFDIENDILWALTEDEQKRLVKSLESIRNLWGIEPAA